MVFCAKFPRRGKIKIVIAVVTKVSDQIKDRIEERQFHPAVTDEALAPE